MNMVLFDVSKYEVPKADEIDMEKTKYNVGVFLSAYKSARSRVGQPLEPKTTTTFNLVPPTYTNQFHSSVEEAVMSNNDAVQEFLELHELFNRGYSAIMHPFKSEVTERRRKVFMLRYMQGLPVEIVCQRINYEKDVVREESNESIRQFAKKLELLEVKH